MVIFHLVIDLIMVGVEMGGGEVVHFIVRDTETVETVMSASTCKEKPPLLSRCFTREDMLCMDTWSI